jgi:hypothetical protein
MATWIHGDSAPDREVMWRLLPFHRNRCFETGASTWSSLGRPRPMSVSMAKTFALVKKGYDPAAVDVFVREQAEAWRSELAKVVEGLGEWQRRAEEFAETVTALEQRLASAERAHAEERSRLETALAETRWARDQAAANLADERAAHARAGAEAGGVIASARQEAARTVAAAEAEVQQMYAQARTRIAMAEAHAKERLDRIEVSVTA